MALRPCLNHVPADGRARAHRDVSVRVCTVGGMVYACVHSTGGACKSVLPLGLET